jgi:hypothetical protein
MCMCVCARARVCAVCVCVCVGGGGGVAVACVGKVCGGYFISGAPVLVACDGEVRVGGRRVGVVTDQCHDLRSDARRPSTAAAPGDSPSGPLRTRTPRSHGRPVLLQDGVVG